ncbi:MAG: MFS transporter [Alphaproteobacteria bacterium]|nr:MFS transporter [Alphaproteobacteria bacterium]
MDSTRLSLIFAAAAHFTMHLLTALFFTVVVALEHAWPESTYDTLLALWTPAAVFIGAMAIPAGWLADRWRASGIVAIGFIGMGAFAIAAGLTEGPAMLGLALAGIGAFAAIYHPVGIPWVMRVGHGRPGRAIAVNGVFGNLGVAAAALVAGTLASLFDWRAAFIVPGALTLVIGIVMAVLIVAGRVVEPAPMPARPVDAGAAARERSDRRRGSVILLFTMFMMGLIFHSLQTAMPKLFELRLDGLAGEDGLFAIGALVSAVFAVASLGQLIGGWFADRFALTRVYLVGFCLQAPLLALLATVGGLPVVLVATIAVLVGTTAVPSESLLLSRYAPPKHQGLAFGIKFVLGMGAGPVAVAAVAWVQGATGEFASLYWGLVVLAAAGAFAALALPRERRSPPAPAAIVVQPAE